MYGLKGVPWSFYIFQAFPHGTPGRSETAESWQHRTHSRSVRCAFLSHPRAATAVCSVKSRRDGLIIAQHAVLGSEECVDQSRKGRLNNGSIACAIRNFPHLFADCRLSSAGAEHQVNQARFVTMRHENQPSLTGPTAGRGRLVFLAHCTQHWFGAVPLFSSCTACMRRTVLGYYQVVPAGLCATNSCCYNPRSKQTECVRRYRSASCEAVVISNLSSTFCHNTSPSSKV